MRQSQAAVCVGYCFDDLATTAMRMQENHVSFSVEINGETKIWDEGQCDFVGEGISHGQVEGEGQESGGVASSSNASPPECEVDELELQLALAMSEEDPRMDEELARRLSELDSVLHVPKVNTEIPLEEESDDKQRLSDRIRLYGLGERKIAGDGNCQFRALSDQLYRTPDHHMFVRRKVVDQLTEARDSYFGYVPMEYNKYLKNMAKYGEWGDHVTLQAAADFYGVKISLITSFKGTHFIEIIPAQQKSNRGSPIFPRIKLIFSNVDEMMSQICFHMINEYPGRNPKAYSLAFGLKFTTIQYTQRKKAPTLRRRKRSRGFPSKD